MACCDMGRRVSARRQRILILYSGLLATLGLVSLGDDETRVSCPGFLF